MRSTVLASLAAVATLAASATANATGFYVGEQDPIATGRGLAVTARLEAPSTIFYNPAGIGFLKGLHVQAGGNLVLPLFSYEDPDGQHPSADADSDLIVVPHVYGVYGVNDKLAFGLGFNSPFGLSLQWPQGFGGESVAAGISLKVPTLYLGASYRPLKSLSFGATFRMSPATVEMVQQFKLVSDGGVMDYGYAHLAGSAIGFGASFGVMARPIDRLHVGFTYLSRMKLAFGNGLVHFGLPDGMTDNSIFHDQGGSVTITTPDILSLGVGYEILRNLYVEFDFDYTLWSVYKDLTVTFDNDASGTLSKPVRKNWRDTPTFRLGGEWSPIPSVATRLSCGYDVSPSPLSTVSPDLPDASRLFLGLGVGYTYVPLGVRLDASYTLVHFLTRTALAKDGNPFPATYKTTAHMFGFSLGLGHF